MTNTTKHQGSTDNFWPRAEENLLKAFEFYLLEMVSPNNNLTTIYKHIANGDIATIDDMFKKLPEDSPAKLSYNIFASGSDVIKASVITGLGTRLQLFQNKDLQNLTSETDIDLSLPGKKPCIYYIITSDMDSSTDFIASLFYAFLFIKLVRYADSRPDGKCENEVFFFLDEFANLGMIPDFNKKISTVRSRGIALIPILQNLGQFENRYPNGLADEIIGNCDTKISTGITDTKTAAYFCKMTGTASAETTAIRKSNSIEGELEEYGQKNISTIKRNLLNEDEIIRLPSSKIYIILRGNQPLLLDKIMYKEHPLANKLKDSPITDYIPNWTKSIKEKKVSKKENSNSNNTKISWDTF